MERPGHPQTFAKQQRSSGVRWVMRLLLGGMWFGWLSGASPAQARPFHYDYYHVAPPQKKQNKREKALLQRVARWYKKQSIPLPRTEAGFQDTARQLASYLAQAPARQLSQRRVHAALWLAGQSALQIQLFAMAFTKEKTLWAQLKKALAQDLAGQRFNVMGLALRQKRQRVCVIVFARRGVKVGLTPRWLPIKQTLRVDAKLLPNFQLGNVVVGFPDGHTQELKVQRAKDTLSFQWRPTKPGTHQIQITVRDERGGWISSQWKVVVYKPPQQDPEKLWKKMWSHRLRQVWGQPKQRTNTTPPKATNSSQVTHRLWQIINAVRRKQGLIEFRRHPRLDKFAQHHARDMVRSRFFGHRSPQYGDFAKRFRNLGWPARNARENIVVAQTPKEALRLWLESAVHRKNLFHPDFIWTGLGAYRAKSGRFYFVQIFVSAL